MSARRFAAARRAALCLLVVVAASLWTAVWATPAGAHSALESSSPAAGSVTAEVPDEITLTFNEPVLLREDSVRLLDAAGDDLDLPEAVVVDDVVSVDLPRDLADGSYVVAWKVMSADSHPVSGAFTFAIGAPSAAGGVTDVLADARAADESSAAAEVLVDVLNGLAYAGFLLAVGIALFRAFVGDHAGQAAEKVAIVGSGVGGLALLLGVVAQAILIEGGDFGLPSGSALSDQVTSAFGFQAALGVLGMVTVVVSMRPLWQNAVRRLIVVDGAVFAIAGFVVVGHTRTSTPVAVSIAADAVHLAAAAVWSGGLVALLLALRRPVDGVERATVVARFSSMATVAIVALVVAGAMLGWRVVGSWSALVDTRYGVLLLVKVGLFALVAAIGTYNKIALVGRVAAAPDGESAGLLRRTATAEIVVLVLVVAVTAALTTTSPNEESTSGGATTLLTCDEVAAMEGQPGMETMDHTCVGETTTPQSTSRPFDPAAAATGGGAAVKSTSFGDGLLVVTVSPGRVGANTVSFTITDAAGASVDAQEPPRVEFRLRAQEIGPITLPADRVGPGAYRVRQDFVLAGEWEIAVSAIVSDFEQPRAALTLVVG
ncbi:MAG: copper resistance protein CopC/CopD [Microthrixaceae bacterium]|nr:copper resistance protein CopC/CopD [Microthrixaceae bacterium]